MTIDEVRAAMSRAMRTGLATPILRGEDVERERQAAHARYEARYGASETDRERAAVNALHAVELMLLEDERGPWIPGALAMPALHLIREGMTA
jgi:hypothetical protein